MLIVGLGNPGKEYSLTHHNIGFILIDKIAESFHAEFHLEKKFQGEVAVFTYNNEKVYLLKPMTYMNNSGIAVKKLIDYYKISIEDTLVIHDDMDMVFGKIRIRNNGSSGGHNGIKSIIKETSSEEFKRFKVGIGHGNNHSEEGIIDFVLSNFTKEEKEIVESIKKQAPEIIKDLLDNNIEFVMNKYN